MTFGVAGSGKSTLASHYKDRFLEINLDECRELVNGNPDDQSNPAGVAAYRDNLIELAAMQGADIMISDTNLNAHFRNLLLDKLQQLGFDVILIVITTPFEKSLEFNSRRDRQVPEDIMHKMKEAMDEQLENNGLHHPAVKKVIYYNPLKEKPPIL